MLAVLRNQSLAYTSGFSPSKSGRKRRRPREKFFATPEKNGTFLPPSTPTLHFLAKESPVCRISSFALFDKTFSPRVFYTVPCSHFPILWCTLTTNRHNTQWVDSESIPWLHRSRFALVLTGAFLEIYFFNALSEKLLSSDWEHLFPLNRYGARP